MGGAQPWVSRSAAGAPGAVALRTWVVNLVSAVGNARRCWILVGVAIVVVVALVALVEVVVVVRRIILTVAWVVVLSSGGVVLILCMVIMLIVLARVAVFRVDVLTRVAMLARVAVLTRVAILAGGGGLHLLVDTRLRLGHLVVSLSTGTRRGVTLVRTRSRALRIDPHCPCRLVARRSRFS